MGTLSGLRAACSVVAACAHAVNYGSIAGPQPYASLPTMTISGSNDTPIVALRVAAAAGIPAVALALAACGSSQPSTSSAAAPAAGKGVAQSATACAAQAGSQTVTTAAHYFVAHMGSQEAMYSPAQVRSMHPKSGEVMIGGAMGAGTSMSGSGMSGMAAGSSSRHLEVKICDRRTGAVTRSTGVRMTISDTTTKGMAKAVSVATMQGVGAGMSDLHYGNNVMLAAGHSFDVAVMLEADHAVFHMSMTAMH